MACWENGAVEVYYYGLIPCSILSIFGCIYIIVIYYSYKELQGYFNKLVLCISLSDLIRSFLLLVPCQDLDNIPLKVIIGVILQATLITTVMWSASISITLYQVVLLSVTEFEKYFKIWVILSCIIVPGLFMLPIITDSYGVQGTVCSIKADYSGFLWRSLLVYLPGMLIVLISLFTFIRTYQTFLEMKLDKRQAFLLKRTSIYPVIMLLDILPIIITRVIQIADKECSYTPIYSIALSIFGLHGFFNAAIFAMNNSAKKVTKGRLTMLSQVSYRNSQMLFGSFSSVNLLDEYDEEGKNHEGLIINTTK
ncbi:hypothetical protein SteCoe_19952 [Stentor coeruleus]|uniref:G-protein coupled receptors family 2 profile 2 domain-containing protein n=1 Tax=Stentor coeruleus TaxID=5963 RepID=A0A1R2BT99_9CILI|nr:hypothetical protein SteCoe_19952 [Stentor coeruleus]